jgi:hypothetical protein
MSDDTSPRAHGGTSRVVRYGQDLASARAEHERVGRQAARMQARQQQLLIDAELRETRRLLLRALRRRRGAEADAFLDEEFLAVADRPAIVHAILTAAVTAGGAVTCDLQRHDPQTRTLRIEAQRGLSDDFAAFLAAAGPARPTASTAALISRQAVIVDDIDHSPHYRSRGALDAMRAAGFRAVHSYPLPDADGEVRGVLSLYFWRRSLQRDASSFIAAAAAHALCSRWDQPVPGPGQGTDQPDDQEAS